MKKRAFITIVAVLLFFAFASGLYGEKRHRAQNLRGL